MRSSAESLLCRYVEEDLVDAGDAFGVWDDDVREFVAQLDEEEARQERIETMAALCEAFISEWERSDDSLDTVGAKLYVTQQMIDALKRVRAK